MAIRLFLTVIFVSVINFLPTALPKTKNPPNPQQCIFVAITDEYYGLYVDDFKLPESPPKNFRGICDATTLSKWRPCPFENVYPVCYPSTEKIQRKFCDRSTIPSQKPCNCSGFLKSRLLEPLPDFPTCFLGEPCVKCIPASRRTARTAPTINNCSRCMTKHPNGGVGSLDLRRVKRAEITPPIRGRFQTIKRRKLLGCYHSRVGSYPLGRKYRRYAPEEGRSRRFRVREPTNSEMRLERNSNMALTRILRRISRSQIIEKRQDKNDDDDDDDDDVDSAGEDIAIEEIEDTTELVISTSDTPEPDERRMQQHNETPNYNLTENFSENEQPKASNISHNRGFSNINSRSVIIICSVFVINLWLRKI